MKDGGAKLRAAETKGYNRAMKILEADFNIRKAIGDINLTGFLLAISTLRFYEDKPCIVEGKPI